MTTIQEFNLEADILRPLLWQHNQAFGLRALLELKKSWVDENNKQFWEDWHRDVFNLKTANAFGCQVWARILGIRLAPPPSADDGPYFGFDEFNVNFDNAPFAPGGPDSIQLTVEQQRIVLRLRYYQLTIRPSVTEINRMLADVFTEGTVYVLDSYDMGPITYVFNFIPAPGVIFVIEQYDLLPRPSTVGVNYTTTAREAFGFGPFNKNYDQAPFGNPFL